MMSARNGRAPELAVDAARHTPRRVGDFSDPSRTCGETPRTVGVPVSGSVGAAVGENQSNTCWTAARWHPRRRIRLMLGPL